MDSGTRVVKNPGAIRKRWAPWPVLTGTAKVMAILLVLYFFVTVLLAGFRGAWNEITDVNPLYLLFGLGLEMAALLAYSLLTRGALNHANITVSRLFRIQLSTKALGNIMPAGSAASSALGYRLLTLSGVPAADAGFALATIGLGSAVVLNLILFIALVLSIPFGGFSAKYVVPASFGLIVIGIAVLLVYGLVKGQRRSERIVRWVSAKFRFDPDRSVEVIQHLATRATTLFRDRRLLARVTFWATANWLLDAAALWVFLKAFGYSMSPLELTVAFCLANVAGVIPITPGGLGVVDSVYISSLVGFGLPKRVATVGVGAYRFAQFVLPTLIGGIAYVSLRVGPWSIDRRDQLRGLRAEAAAASKDDTSGIEWAEKYGRRNRRPTEELPIVPGDPLTRSSRN